MQRFVLFVLLALLVASSLSIVSCKKQGSSTTTADTTTTNPMARDTSLTGSTSAPSGTAATTADTTHNRTTDTTHAAGTTSTSGTKETATSAATETPTTGDKGIGPVTTLTLGAIDTKLVTQGQQLYNSKCIGCHKLEAKAVGPALGKAANEVTPEYIMNIMLNPTEMEQKTPRAKLMVQQTGKHMPALKLTQDQARAILEYLRSVAAGK